MEFREQNQGEITMKRLLMKILTAFILLWSLSIPAYAASGESDEGLNRGTKSDQKKSTDEELASSALPIVQSYEIDDGSQQWTLDKSTRIIIPDKDEYIKNSRLKEVVELVSAEFLEKKMPSKSEIHKLYAKESEATPEDIVITLDKNQPITEDSNSEESYKIDIGSDGVKIVAASENAAMYALRTIQQLIITNDNELAYGTIIDYPDLSERRMHVDMARKHITKGWIIQHIREMSYLKMNAIQLHFSENKGFRIESDFDPEIVSEDGYLAKSEVKEILAEAKKYGVKVIPSFDTPGHVDHILKAHPEYGQVDKDGNHSDSALDVTNPEAVNYIKKLYSEYMDLFEDSTDFNIGADEYMEFDRPPFTTKYKQVLDDYAHETLGKEYTWKDTMANYINEIAEHVHDQGFKPRIFNDGIYYGEDNPEQPKQKIKMHDYIGIDFWSQMSWNPDIADLNTFVEKGHKDIYNLNSDYFYYVLRDEKPDDGREQHSFDHLNQDKRIYNKWTPGRFDQNRVDDDSDFIKGTSLAIWNDNPDLIGEDLITKDIAKALRSLATKSWNTESNNIVDIKDFKESYKKLGNVAGFEKGSELPSVQSVLPNSIGSFKKIVNQYEEIGKVDSQKAAHKLKVHLTATGHFADHNSTKKAIKHMKNFKQFVKHYEKKDVIEKGAAKKLKKSVDLLIKEWDES